MTTGMGPRTSRLNVLVSCGFGLVVGFGLIWLGGGRSAAIGAGFVALLLGLLFGDRLWRWLGWIPHW